MAGGLVQIDAEGTNELDAGETFNGWTPVFVKPDGTTVTGTVMGFTSPQGGKGPVPFKMRYTVTDPNGTGKGDWKGRSQLQWVNDKGAPGSHTKDSDKVSVP